MSVIWRQIHVIVHMHYVGIQWVLIPAPADLDIPGMVNHAVVSDLRIHKYSRLNNYTVLNRKSIKHGAAAKTHSGQ